MGFQDFIARESIIQNNIRLRKRLQIPLEERTKIEGEDILASECGGKFSKKLNGICFCNFMTRKVECEFQKLGPAPELYSCRKYFRSGLYFVKTITQTSDEPIEYIEQIENIH